MIHSFFLLSISWSGWVREVCCGKLTLTKWHPFFNPFPRSAKLQGKIQELEEYGVWVIVLIMAQKLSIGVSNWT
jgi:hypothetical protein